MKKLTKKEDKLKIIELNNYFFFSKIGLSSIYVDNCFKQEINNIMNIKNWLILSEEIEKRWVLKII